jgi:hypothetical protein
MKQFWHEYCLEVYFRRFKLIALLLVIAVWILLAELVVSVRIRDLLVYACFGWFVLGEILVPWTERKLEQLFG